MATKIFVNLAVKDLDKSKEFFTKIGFSINPQFSDDSAACIVISEDIFAMILSHERYKQFTKKEIGDSTKTSEVLNCLTFDSKEKVNIFVDAAVKAGATEPREPMDYGFMFARSFDDLDGHTWEAMYMDMNAVPPKPE